MASAKLDVLTGAPTECGFCLRTNDDMEDPKVLPCTHVHCLECLNAFYKRKHVVRCPLTTCGETFDVTIDSLEPYTDSTWSTLWCDICLSKKKTRQPAVCYCSTCNKKYCTKHAESHEDVTEDHPVLSMNIYRTQATKLEVRLCVEHEQKPYSAGCKVCYKMICVDCLPGLSSSTGGCGKRQRFGNPRHGRSGASHELFPLDKLTALLLEEINKLKLEMLAKEDVLEQLFKTTTKTISDFDDKTREMLELIWRTRDEQLVCIEEKYAQLEEELLEQRQKFKQQIAEFKEGDVGEKWSDVRNQRLRLDARIDHSHQCDIVSGYKDTVAEMKKIIGEELPSLELSGVVSLTDAGESREIELEMTSEQVVIKSDQWLRSSPARSHRLGKMRVARPASLSPSQRQKHVAKSFFMSSRQRQDVGETFAPGFSHQSHDVGETFVPDPEFTHQRQTGVDSNYSRF